jgi:radical SAM protein with 4Fe4S-binding SPASM domain
MKESSCKKIIKEASSMGVSEIVFSGGEPLLWNSLIDCIFLANKLAITTTVYTSGCVDNFSSLLTTMKENGLQKIIFSLYGSEAKIHDYVTRKDGSLSNTLSAIDISLKNQIITEVHFVVLKCNYFMVDKVIALCESKGISDLSILRFVSQGRGKLLTSMNSNDYSIFKDTLKKHMNRRIKIRTGSPLNFLMLNKNPQCLSGIDRLIISPNLDIFPCDAFKGFTASIFSSSDKYSNLGNISLSECWEKSEYLNLIRNKINDYGKTCYSCTSFDSCRSGCLAQKMATYGSLVNKPDPLCLMGEKDKNASRKQKSLF